MSRLAIFVGLKVLEVALLFATCYLMDLVRHHSVWAPVH